ncbi:XAC2610-related protein [Cupriavidus sp. P-10]|uniref:XAC2610-related protein n=1 Tax=Cupriavidus sp. P-10 TaxID=2027911 RepID=UPI003FA43F5D
MRNSLYLFVFALIVHCGNAKAIEEIAFTPSAGVKATIAIHDSLVSVRVCSTRNCNSSVFSVDADNSNSIRIEKVDYNFDGKIDFSLKYLDEGMGVYFIHRVFLYSKTTRNFKEYFPRCGDEFINLKIDKKKRRLISTYFRDNTPKLCISYPPKSL